MCYKQQNTQTQIRQITERCSINRTTNPRTFTLQQIFMHSIVKSMGFRFIVHMVFLLYKNTFWFL